MQTTFSISKDYYPMSRYKKQNIISRYFSKIVFMKMCVRPNIFSIESHTNYANLNDQLKLTMKLKLQ